MTSPRKRLNGPIHGRLRKLVDKNGLSLTEFADKVGVHISVASHWVNGRARPDLSRLPKIARVLDVSVLDLVRGERAWSMYQQALEAAA